MYHVARELSRRGWHVMPTVRNARGSDLYAASDDESVVLRIQSKALSKKVPVPLGISLADRRSADACSFERGVGLVQVSSPAAELGDNPQTALTAPIANC